MEELFPNLKHVSQLLYVLDNKGKIPFSFFDDFEIPRDSIEYWFGKNRIEVYDNSNIEGCFSPYLCKALKAYPDSVFIEGNNGTCNIDDIINYCISGVDNGQISKIKIYPNPVSDQLHILWEGGSIDAVTITNALGVRVIRKNGMYAQEIDVSFLSPGVYVVEFTDKGRTVAKEFFVKL